MARITNKEHRETSIAAVLAAAEYLFVTRGYNGTTTAEIGKLAGLTKGAVYFYFQDKEAILLELLNDVRRLVLIPVRERLRDKSLRPAKRIAAVLEFNGQIATQTPGAMLLPIVVSIEFAGTNSPAEQRVKAGYRKVAQEIQALLEEGQALGEFRTDLSANTMARALIATTDGLMLECLRNDLEIRLEELIATLSGIVRVGVGRHATGKAVAKADAGSERSVRVIDVLKARLRHPVKATAAQIRPKT